MNEFQVVIGYKFNDIQLLNRAMTHSSYANETKDSEGSNERLEFLGDAVLSIIVSDSIFRDYKNLPEGELTKIRASLVCENSLCSFAKEINLGVFENNQSAYYCYKSVGFKMDAEVGCCAFIKVY